jgi:SPP1 family predicted phage head-tail adaptor
MPDRYSARDMHRLIEILVQSKASDGGGGKTITYVSTSPPTLLPALVAPKSAGESTYADQTSSFEGLDVVIRYRAGLNQTMRVKYGSRQFEIQGIVDLDERHRWMRLTCEERLGE